MSILKLQHGPRLVQLVDQAAEDGVSPETREKDVTAEAHQYLYNTLTLAENVTLADIFGLLEADPVLVSVYRRDFAESLLEHVRKGVHPDFKPGYHPDEIEYLELYACWNFDSGERILQGSQRLDFHGVGYALREDVDRDGYVDKMGSRTHWGVSLTDPRMLLPLPLRVDYEVRVFEDDTYSRTYGTELLKFHLSGVTLGQVIQGVLWELSFHGTPEDSAATRDELVEQSAMIRAERTEMPPDGLKETRVITHTAEELFEALLGDSTEESMSAHFEDLAGMPPMKVYSVLRELDDDAIPEDALNEAFQLNEEPRIRVKPAFKELKARDLRAALGNWTPPPSGP